MVVRDAWPDVTGSQGDQDDQDNASFTDQTSASKKRKIEDLGKKPPVYKEEDITGLFIKGTNVYQGEKRYLMNVLDDLLSGD